MLTTRKGSKSPLEDFINHPLGKAMTPEERHAIERKRRQDAADVSYLVKPESRHTLGV